MSASRNKNRHTLKLYPSDPLERPDERFRTTYRDNHSASSSRIRPHKPSTPQWKESKWHYFDDDSSEVRRKHFNDELRNYSTQSQHQLMKLQHGNEDRAKHFDYSITRPQNPQQGRRNRITTLNIGSSNNTLVIERPPDEPYYVGRPTTAEVFTSTDPLFREEIDVRPRTPQRKFRDEEGSERNRNVRGNKMKDWIGTGSNKIPNDAKTVILIQSPVVHINFGKK